MAEGLNFSFTDFIDAEEGKFESASGANWVERETKELLKFPMLEKTRKTPAASTCYEDPSVRLKKRNLQNGENQLHLILDKLENMSALFKSEIASVKEDISSFKEDFRHQLTMIIERSDNQFKNITNKVNSFQSEIKNLKEKTCQHQTEIEKLKEENESLAMQLDHVVQKDNLKSVIFSGSTVALPPNYNPANRSSLLPLINHVVREKLDLNIHPQEIEDCHLISKPNEKPRIMITTQTTFLKDAIISSYIMKKKVLKKDELYVNESLSPNNSKIFHKLREAKKTHPEKIFSVFTRNGTSHIKWTSKDRPKKITSMEDIDTLLNVLTSAPRSSSSAVRKSQRIANFNCISCYSCL